jgi:hypothetical protein
MIDTLDTIVYAVDSLSTTVLPTVITPSEPWYVTHYVELIFIGLAAIKAVLNLVPSEQPRVIFGYVDTLIGLIFKDRRK